MKATKGNLVRNVDQLRRSVTREASNTPYLDEYCNLPYTTVVTGYANGRYSIPVLLSLPMNLQFITLLFNAGSSPTASSIKVAIYKLTSGILESQLRAGARPGRTIIKIAEAINSGNDTSGTLSLYTAEFNRTRLAPGAYFVVLNNITSADTDFASNISESLIHWTHYTDAGLTDVGDFPGDIILPSYYGPVSYSTPTVILRSFTGQFVAQGSK